MQPHLANWDEAVLTKIPISDVRDCRDFIVTVIFVCPLFSIYLGMLDLLDNWLRQQSICNYKSISAPPQAPV